MQRFGRWVVCAAAMATVAPSVVAAQSWQQRSTPGFYGSLSPTREASVRLPQGRFVLRCRDLSLEGWIEPRTRLAPARRTEVALLVADREPVRQQWLNHGDERGAQAPSPGLIARHLLAGRSVTVEFRDSQGAAITMMLDANRASAAVRQVLRGCGLAEGDMDVLLPGVDSRVIDDLDRANEETTIAVGLLLMDRAYQPEQTNKPLSLYQALGNFYSVTLPAACRDETSDYWGIAPCIGYREQLAAGGGAGMPVGPLAALREFNNQSQMLLHVRPPQAPVTDTTRSCAGVDLPPRAITSFNVAAAYPIEAVRRGVRGDLVLEVDVSSAGAPVRVRIVQAIPRGVFERSVEREAMKMRFEPATRDCMPVDGTYEMRVSFQLSG